MAMDLAPYNIRVNSVVCLNLLSFYLLYHFILLSHHHHHWYQSPGTIFTAASERHAKVLNMSVEQFKEQHGNLCVMKRMAEAREVAAPIAFLASKDASYITGSDLLVDGGYCLP